MQNGFPPRGNEERPLARHRLCINCLRFGGDSLSRHALTQTGKVDDKAGLREEPRPDERYQACGECVHGATALYAQTGNHIRRQR